MEHRNAVIRLSEGDETICPFFIENPMAMRRVCSLLNSLRQNE